MEVPVGVCETCALLVFLFLTQITEQYLDVVSTEEQEVREGGRGAGFPIISDMMKAPGNGEDRQSCRLMPERAGGRIS